MATEIVVIISGGSLQGVFAKGDAQFSVSLIDLDCLDDPDKADKRDSKADVIMNPKSGFNELDINVIEP